MINESYRRLPHFSRGISMILADGQEWWAPAPGDIGPAEGTPDEYSALIDGIVTAEDGAGRSLAELALGIHLLDRNYRLESHDLRALLDVPFGSPRAATVRASLRSAAEAHVGMSLPDAPAVPSQNLGWCGYLARLAGRAFGRRINSAT